MKIKKFNAYDMSNSTIDKTHEVFVNLDRVTYYHRAHTLGKDGIEIHFSVSDFIFIKEDTQTLDLLSKMGLE